MANSIVRVKPLSMIVTVLVGVACGKAADRNPTERGSAERGTVSTCTDKLDAIAKLFETQVAAEDASPLPNGYSDMKESGGLVSIDHATGDAREADYLSIGKDAASVTAPSGVTEDLDVLIKKPWTIRAKTLALAPAAEAPWRSVEAALRDAATSYDAISIVYRTDLAFAHRPKPKLAEANLIDWFDSAVAELRAHPSGDGGCVDVRRCAP